MSKDAEEAKFRALKPCICLGHELQPSAHKDLLCEPIQKNMKVKESGINMICATFTFNMCTHPPCQK